MLQHVEEATPKAPGSAENNMKGTNEGPMAPKAWHAQLLPILGIAGVAGLIIMAIIFFRPNPEVTPTTDKSPFVQVVTAQPQSGPIKVVGHGRVEPRARIRLSAQVAGEVVEVSPTMVSGGVFRQGDLLIQLDARSYEAALAQVAADKEAAEAALVFASQQIERTQALKKRGFAATEKFEQLQSQKREAQARVAKLDAQLKQAELNLEHTTITAPFDGRVDAESIDIGEYVSPGQELARIFTTDAVEVVVALSDNDATLLPNLWNRTTNASQKPQAVVSASYGDGVYGWTGHVDRAEATVDDRTRTIDVVVRVNNPYRAGIRTASPHDAAQAALGSPPPLLVGMYAKVEIEGLAMDRYFVLPESALRDGNRMWIVSNENTLQSVSVAVKQRQDEMIIVTTADIPDDARVVKSKLAVATANMRVRILSPRENGSDASDGSGTLAEGPSEGRPQ